jgi:hypothetical protein
MSGVLQLTGYDKNTEVVRVEIDLGLEDREVDSVKLIAGVPPEDPDVLGSYPLSEQQVIQIAGVAGRPLNPRLYNYFLEAY